jgi:hypothetical protein
MKRFRILVTVAVLAAGALTALAETDYVSLPVIRDIQQGRNTRNQIVDLRVQDDATVGGDLAVTGDVSGQDVTAGGNVVAGTNGTFGGVVDAASVTVDAGAGIDAQSAGALGFGLTTATSTDIGKTATMTTIKGTLNADEAVTLDSTLTTAAATYTTYGVGAVVDGYCSVVEYGVHPNHQTILTVTGATDVLILDGDHGGGLSFYAFPEGVINIRGVTATFIAVTTTNYNASDNDHFDVGIGTVVAADDNALSGTEQNLIAVIDEDTVDGTTTNHAETAFLATSVIVDGSSTPALIAVNYAIEATQNDSSNVLHLTVGDTIAVTWDSLGDI